MVLTSKQISHAIRRRVLILIFYTIRSALQETTNMLEIKVG